MRKPAKILCVILCLGLVSAFVAACGPPKTLTDTFTEQEFLQEEFICQDNGMAVDFKPGKIICNGELGGQQVVVEIVAEIVDGNGGFKIVRMTVDGVDAAPEELANLNDGLAKDTLIPEEGYTVTAIIITDNELTITRSLK